MASAVVTVAVYDVLVLPLWLLMTHRIPSPADVLGKCGTKCSVFENLREKSSVLTADMQKNGLTLANLPRPSLPISFCSVRSLSNSGEKLMCWCYFFLSLRLSVSSYLKHVFVIISAGVLFIWGAICLKLSHMHFSHNLFLKRLNILVVCVSVLMEIIQPDLNVYRVSATMYVPSWCFKKTWLLWIVNG